MSNVKPRCFRVVSCSISELLKNKEGWEDEYQEFFFFEKITSFACLVGSGLKDMFQLKVKSRIFTKLLFSSEAETLAVFTTKKRKVSSANSLTLVVRPRTEPCATPAVTDFQTEDWPLKQPVDICCLKTI